MPIGSKENSALAKGAAILLTVFCTTAPSLATTSTDATRVAVETWRGHQVVRLSGPIVEGAAERLAAVADEAEVLPHGLPILLLDSPGGSVAEGLAIARLLRERPFHTVIPNDATCASACASIVFIAGTARTVEPFGLLGQHSCSRGGRADGECNEIISRHAMAHGVSHGSVSAFVTYTPPDDILWFSREDADGWGLTRYPGEDENGFEKSEPRVFAALTGRMPPAQAAWRIDFHEDGYRAFLRPVADHAREMQLNLYCRENMPGRLFLSMEVGGPASVVAEVTRRASVTTDVFSFHDASPVIRQMDDTATEIVVEIPRDRILPFLRRARTVEFALDLKSPFEPMVARTFLDGSRPALLFAANNCASGTLRD